ncbi:5-hydroxytryptamine receptor 3C-like [Protopterus annectens]|uniref:5-hydroxytryptamine receptor 3C-like n=1 Tax=Protopterus annectens TaxID=7888 RepID=UPI001CFA5EE0|nr:5-hydroxytryptamine receptor 3C-like [Protopterus annectens]
MWKSKCPDPSKKGTMEEIGADDRAEGGGKCVFSQINCSGSIESFLDSFQDIFEKKPFRPVLSYDHPTHVNISFSLYAVLGVNEKVQILTTFLWFVMYWENEFIGWDPNECGGISQISVSTENIWLPDILINEFMDEDTSPTTPYLYVNYRGRIKYEKPMRVVSSCSLDIFNFPFDMQNCSLTFSAYLHTAADITIGLAKPAQEISDVSKTLIQTKGEWQLCGISAEEIKVELGKDYYSEIIFHVAIKRRPIQYVVNLLVPSAFLMLIDVMSFYLPPHTVDRAAFKMTLILGYTVFLLMMNDLLPATASGVPLISTYFSLCLALMVTSLLETVAITYILHCGPAKYPAVPHWVRKLVLHHIAKVLCWKHQESSDFTAKDDTIIMNTAAQVMDGEQLLSSFQQAITDLHHSPKGDIAHQGNVAC